MKKILSFLMAGIILCALASACATAENPAPTQSAQEAMQPDTSDFIGEEKAKELALSSTGIDSDGVVFERVELDRDEGVWVYEVEFKKDATQHDIKIKADDGTILSKETDIND